MSKKCSLLFASSKESTRAPKHQRDWISFKPTKIVSSFDLMLSGIRELFGINLPIMRAYTIFPRSSDPEKLVYLLLTSYVRFVSKISSFTHPLAISRTFSRRSSVISILQPYILLRNPNRVSSLEKQSLSPHLPTFVTRIDSQFRADPMRMAYDSLDSWYRKHEKKTTNAKTINLSRVSF